MVEIFEDFRSGLENYERGMKVLQPHVGDPIMLTIDYEGDKLNRILADAFRGRGRYVTPVESGSVDDRYFVHSNVFDGCLTGLLRDLRKKVVVEGHTMSDSLQ